MKKIIRWLADISGVTKQIEADAYKMAGKEMQMYAHWFTGGTFVDGHKYDMSNVLYEYPKYCLNRGWPHLYGGQSMEFREMLWKLSDEGRSVILEEYKGEYHRDEFVKIYPDGRIISTMNSSNETHQIIAKAFERTMPDRIWDDFNPAPHSS